MITKEICGKCGSSNFYSDRECKSCVSAYNAAHYQANKAKKAEYRDVNRKAGLVYAAAYYLLNRERLAVTHAIYAANNPEIIRAKRMRRRRSIQGAGGNVTALDLKELMVLQKGRCPICTADIKRKYHADHINPITRGGANDRTNIQLLCPTCNNQKNAKHPIDFMQSRGFLL